MNEAVVAKAIQTRYTNLLHDQEEIFDDVERYKAMYRCKMEPDESYPWEYQLVDPQIFPAIRAYLARMNPAEARIYLSGASEFREVNQDVVNWELNEILITQLLYRIMYSGFMGGHGYAKTGWFYKPAVKVKTDRGEFIMRSIQNRADAQFVRFNDLMIPNRNIPEIESQPYLIERVYVRYGDLLDDLEQTPERWKPDLIKQIGEKGMFTDQIDYGVDLPKEETEKEEVLQRSQYVGLLCMHTIDGGEYWTFLKDKEKIINKDTGNRYWHGHYPYIDFCPFPEDDEFFSMGVPTSIEDFEIALSSTLNQLMTNARKAGNSMWLVGESGKQVPDWMFVDRPNGIVRVKGNLADYQRMDYNNNTSKDLLQLRGELTSSSEKTSGISSLYSSGVASTPQINKTATGAKIIDNNIDQNLQLIISLFGAQVLKKMGEHFLELNQQYITEDQTFEITGKKGSSEQIKVRSDQISANFKVQASAERLLKTSPAVKLASLQNTIQTLSQQKNVQVNMKPIYSELLSETPGLEDIDAENVLIDPEKKANEVADAIVKGYEPPAVRWDDDHKSMLTILQKYLLDTSLPNEVLALFVDYISELKSWIEAKNQNLVIQPPPEPQLQPTDEQALMQSMNRTAQIPGGNPTQGMPAGLTVDQLGM